MSAPLVSNLGAGARKIRNNPQLLYTIAVAVIIIAAFVFMANYFIGIAQSAQERLVNVRVGSIQDAFVSFAGDRLDDPAYLDQKIKEIITANATIQNFRVIRKQTLTTAASTTVADANVIVASNISHEIGQTDPEADFLYGLAANDPDNSLTIEVNDNGTRLFNTARAITDRTGAVEGVVMTSQTLSEADAAIQHNITNSIYLLIAIVVVIIILFVRHSRIVDYIDLYKRLKEVDQLKDDFISMASHELRTPLTVIRGYAEYMREAPELTAATKEYATKIDISARDLDSLVADILDVSRIEQGRMSFKKEKLNPREMIAGVVASLEPVAKDKGLAISFEAAEGADGHSITADPERLRQVVVNLVGNAVKYTKQGSVKVSQFARNGRLDILVEDTGIGIGAEEREHLFEKFYRIRTADTADIRGTGLGLWITARLVKEMKGTISLESIKGVGSHFTVSFPLIN